MTYVCFVTRDPLTTFNSIYAYAKLRAFPQKILVFYTVERNLHRFISLINALYEAYNRDIEISTRKIEDEFKDIGEEIKKIKGDILIDITGARKSHIIAIMSTLRKGVIVYLRLEDMSFSKIPMMMRPLSLQKIIEVAING